MFTVYDGIEAYAKKANSAFYIACKTAIFNNPDDQVLTPKGRVTRVRQYDSGKAGNYNKSKGWMTQYGSGDGIKWIEYKAPYDRAKVLFTDAIDEEQSFAAGMVPSIELLNSDFMDNQLPQEIDATNIAQFYNRVPLTNRHTISEDGFGIDPENILGTLNKLETYVFDSGYDGDTVLFISSEAYANFITAIQNKMGLASNVLLQKTATVYIDTGIDSIIPGADSSISVNLQFEAYGRFLLIRVPEDRMYSNIIMYSGDPDDPVQYVGGVVPDFTNPNFARIHLLAMPLKSAFTNIRYMVDNFLYPSFLQSNYSTRVDLRKLNERMFGNVEINHAGINQKANAFEYDIRAIYGGDVYDNRRRNCFAVTDDPAARKKVTTITLTDPAGSNTVDIGAELQLKVDVAPTDAFDKSVEFSVTDGTGKASISSTGVVTGLKEGTATAVAKALDGSGVTGSLEVTVNPKE